MTDHTPDRTALRADEEQPATETHDPGLLAELQQHLADHTPSCNARTDHLMRRAAWALGAPRPAHIGGNAEDCPGCEGTNPPYPFICPDPAVVAEQPTAADTDETATQPECAHCWREIENRCAPTMNGPGPDNWVHVPGGFKHCFPQKPDSPLAEPRP